MKWRTIYKDYTLHHARHYPLLLDDGAVYRIAPKGMPKSGHGWPIVIDTGSPVTLIPKRAAMLAGISHVVDPGDGGTETFTLGDHKTSVTVLNVYAYIWQKDFGFVGRLTAGMVDRDDILLGRDSLETLLFIYDGKHEKFLVRKRKKVDHVPLGLLGFLGRM